MDGLRRHAACARFGHDSTAVARHLLHTAGVACTPGDDFGTEAGHQHLRFSYTAPVHWLAEVLERMGAALR